MTSHPRTGPRRADEYDHLAGELAELAGLDPSDPTRRGLRDRLAAELTPLARHLARRFVGRGEPLEDLEQVALVGLLGALDRYDPGRGRSFVAYAVPTINGELRRYFRDHGWALAMPRDLRDRHVRLGAATTALRQELGREPEVVEVADRTGLTPADVRAGYLASAAYRSRSLDELPGDGTDAGAGLGDLLGAPDPGLAAFEDRELVAWLLIGLPARERRLLALRFEAEMTQAEIGAELGISQMHVSRLLTRILAELRALLLD